MRMGIWTSSSRRAWPAAALLAGALALGAAFAASNPVPGPKKDEFQTKAPHAILIDRESGSILFEKNADQLMAPSSLAKLMTAEVVFNLLRQKSISLTPSSSSASTPGGTVAHPRTPRACSRRSTARSPSRTCCTA